VLPEIYHWLWIVYGLSGCLLILAIWWLTRRSKFRWVGHILMLMVAVLVFTPAKLYQVPEYFVPASTALVFDKLLGNEDAVLAAGTNLVISSFAVFIFYILAIIVFRFVRSRNRS